MSDVLRKTFKTLFPLLIVKRHNEDVITNGKFSDTPAMDRTEVDGGETFAAVFVGVESHIKDVYDLKTGKDPALEDNITEWRSMNLLRNNSTEWIIEKMEEHPPSHGKSNGIATVDREQAAISSEKEDSILEIGDDIQNYCID